MLFIRADGHLGYAYYDIQDVIFANSHAEV